MTCLIDLTLLHRDETVQFRVGGVSSFVFLIGEEAGGADVLDVVHVVVVIVVIVLIVVVVHVVGDVDGDIEVDGYREGAAAHAGVECGSNNGLALREVGWDGERDADVVVVVGDS